LISGVKPENHQETVGKMSDGGARFNCCADIGYAEDTHAMRGSRAWTREHHFNSLLIVTGAITCRAPAGILRALPDKFLIAYPVDRAASIWAAVAASRTVQLLHREYVKYLASLVTTRLGQ